MAEHSLSTIPLSLYIHFPWCVKKCPYCDFNSHTHRGDLPEQAYIDALIDDLDTELPLIKGRKLHSIFMGGGTPSLFSAQAIGQLLEKINQRLPFDHALEITLEANPGTTEQQRFCDYRAVGINRLSLGIQSFAHEHLKRLGRIHDGHHAQTAIIQAQRAGFDNINIDLMFALPQQSVAEALHDLQQACQFSPSHLSWYQLTIEPNTWFHAHPPPLPDDELAWQINSEGISYLATQNYHRYEISAYSQPHRHCIHNSNYWEFGDYLGIGAGAHSKITMIDEKHIIRRVKSKHPKDYLLPHSRLASSVRVQDHELAFEFMLNTLRLIQGVPLRLFTARTGRTRESIAPLLQQAIARELIEPSDEYLKTTALGRQFLNDTLQIFL